MKQLLLLAAVLGIYCIAPAQNVGINETTPSAKFEIKGTGSSSATSAFIVKNSASSLIMRVRDDGNIGIGVGTPQYRMDINGRIRIQTGSLGNITTTSGIWLDDFRDGTTRIFTGMQDSIRWGLYGENSGLGWDFNFNSRTGNVGMGMIGGSGKLTINQVSGNNIDFYGNGDYSGSVRSTDTSLALYSSYGGFLCFPSPCTPPPPKDLFLNPQSTGFLSPIAGRVGIRTYNLATGYALSVGGKIISEEVRVQLSSAWPDYVFNRNYKLMSLPQLEQYIEDNQHLPNIPSAVEMQGGQDLGEIQRRMMEKIEELHLYMIELDKENKELRKEIESLKKKKRK